LAQGKEGEEEHEQSMSFNRQEAGNRVSFFLFSVQLTEFQLLNAGCVE
jgi:hypothetical protein